LSDKESYTKFNDVSASPTSLGIETEVYTYSFSTEQDADYIVIRYVFKNTTPDTISNFYAGQYWDFDLDATSYDDDVVGYDTDNNFGYVYDNDGNPISTYIGLALLSEGNIGFFAMNNTGHINPIISWDGFSDEEKWTALTSGLNYSSTIPSDISALISDGPHNLDPNSKIEVDFVVVAGDNLSDLRDNVQEARIKYQEIPTDVSEDNFILNSFGLEQNYPNPFNPSTTIKYSIPSSSVMLNSIQHLNNEIPAPGQNDNINVKLSVYDILGREVVTIVNKNKKAGNYQVSFDGSKHPSGVYYYRLIVGSLLQTKKMILLK